MIWILFGLYFSNGPTSFQQEFNSQGACQMALTEGKRQAVFDRAFCAPKG